MKKLIIFILINFIAVISVYSQFSADVDGSLNVSDVSGSVRYSYPISNTTIDGYPITVDLNYDDNVMFSVYDKYEIPNLSYDKLNWADHYIRLVRKQPAWIMGVNGFAINVFGYKSRFNSHGIPVFNHDDIDALDPDEHMGDYDANWIIDGYDVCNIMTLPDNANFQDQIKILKSDGSILELGNTTLSPDNTSMHDTNLYVGYYYDLAVNSTIYGVVTFDTTRNWPQYIRTKYYGDDTATADTALLRKPRVLRLYMGDGLEYVFREYVAPYGMREDLWQHLFYPDNASITMHSGGDSTAVRPYPSFFAFPKATVFYLEEINSSMGTLTTFERAWHNFDEGKDSLVIRGRAPITHFANHDISFSEGSIEINAFHKSYKLEVGNKIFGEHLDYSSGDILFNNKTPISADSVSLFYDNILEEPMHLPSPFLNYADVWFRNSEYFQYLVDDSTNNQIRIHNGTCNEKNVDYYANNDNFSQDQWGCGIWYVKQIIDPEGRRTKFDYTSVSKNYQGFYPPFSGWIPGVTSAGEVINLVFHRFQLSKITEPTKILELNYASVDSYVTGNDYPDMNTDPDQTNIVTGITIKDKTSQKVLKTSNYVYSFSNPVVTTITVNDSTTGKQFKKINTFQKYDRTIPFQDLVLFADYNQYLHQTSWTNPQYVNISSQLISDEDTLLTTNSVEPLSYFTLDTNQQFYYYPSESRKYHNNQLISLIKYDYEADQLNDFSLSNYFTTTTEQDIVKGKIGWGIKKQIARSYQVDDTTQLMNETETDYLNLKTKFGVTISRYETALKNNAVLNARLKYFRDADYTYDDMFETVEITKTANLPAIWALPTKIVVKDRNGDIIGGKILNYDTLDNIGDTAPNRRGALLSDSLISEDGTSIRLGHLYSYTGGQFRNFLAKTENIQGGFSKLYYDYGKIPGYESTNPTANIMHNDEDVTSVTFNDIYPEFENPVGFETDVRKTDATWVDGVITYQVDTLRMRSITEKSQYGLVTGYRDLNGWFWESNYDSNGRVSRVRYPYDFPTSYVRDKGRFNDCVPVTTYHTNRVVTHETVTIASGTYNISRTSTYRDSLDGVMLVGNVVNESSTPLPPIPPIPIPVPPIYKKNTSYSSVLTYEPSPYDRFHDSSTVTGAALTLHLEGSVSRFCKTVQLKIPETGYSTEVMIACPEVDRMGDDCDPYSQDFSPVEVKFNLTPALAAFEDRALNAPLDMEISLISGTGIVNIDRFSEDENPCIGVTGTNTESSNDFTYAFNYSDTGRTTETLAKIDDKVISQYDNATKKYTHSNNTDFAASFSSYDGRYTASKGIFGADNTPLCFLNVIGAPLSPVRSDTITFDYSGLKVTDPAGYESRIETDGLGRITKQISPDGTFIEYEYDFGIPSKFNLGSGEDYFGMCYKVTVTGKDTVSTTSYYDAYNRLRRVVQDTCPTGCFNVLTKYDYDDKGHLTALTHPDGSVTGYKYDEWGRVIREYDPDAGVKSAAYDNLGNLRFSQDTRQRDSNKVTFLEYDDLGRKTLVGEAKIDTTGMRLKFTGDSVRITDKLDPDRMNIFDPGGGSCSTCLLTANPSIWIDKDYNYINGIMNHILNGDTITNQNVIDYISLSDYMLRTIEMGPYNEDAYLETFPGPFILHNATYYTYKPMPTASKYTFENAYSYPEFVRTVIQYDTLPKQKGIVWKNFPNSNNWAKLLPKREFRNHLGKPVAIAYRDDATQPFHYLVFSYDARGRVEAMVRYTENLGFDGVYYRYNSADQPINVTAVDAVNQFNIWYDYDNNGRMQRVFTKFAKDSGFSHSHSLDYEDFEYPWPLTKPTKADMAYYYNKRGLMDSISYAGGCGTDTGFTKQLYYDANGWVDSLIARRHSDTIFYQSFVREIDGKISLQRRRDVSHNVNEETYAYDRLSRLTDYDGGILGSQEFTYDIMGNRSTQTNNGITSMTYNYNMSLPNRLENLTSGANVIKSYNYTQNGEIDSIRKGDGTVLSYLVKMDYNFAGFTTRFKKYNLDTLYPVTNWQQAPATYDHDKWDWRYRSGPFGTREQSREYYSPRGDSLLPGGGSNIHHWTYSLTGIVGEEIGYYKGVQTASPEDTVSGRRVYFFAERFMAAGGEVQVIHGNAKEFHVRDALGSVRFVVRSLNVEYVEHSAFGDTAVGDTSRKTWKGYDAERESGLVRMGARMYMADVGRFMSTDPLSNFMAFTSPYQYAFNNPVMFGDPTGLAPEKNEKHGDRLLGGDAGCASLGLSNPLYPCENGAIKAAEAEFRATHIDEGAVWWNDMWGNIHVGGDLLVASLGGKGGGRVGSPSGVTGHAVQSTFTAPPRNGYCGVQITGVPDEALQIQNALANVIGAEMTFNEDGSINSIKQVDASKNFFFVRFMTILDGLYSSNTFTKLDIRMVHGTEANSTSNQEVEHAGGFWGIFSPDKVYKVPYLITRLNPDNQLRYHTVDDRILSGNQLLWNNYRNNWTGMFTLEAKIVHEIFGHVYYDLFEPSFLSLSEADRESFVVAIENIWHTNFEGQKPRDCYWCEQGKKDIQIIPPK